MKFRTEIDIPTLPHKLSYNANTLLIGSCFTNNIGSYMQRYKFMADVNPFGVIYNPASICNSLNLLLNGEHFNDADLLYQNGLWFSYAHHSSFSSTDKKQCLAQINNQLQKSSVFLQQTDYLFITLGSAYAYKLKQSGKVVANCHKTQASEFERILLPPNIICNEFSTLLNRLLEKTPTLKIIFSVSPIRHLKDGAHGNQLSKACLLLAIDELQRLYSGSCFYFPAYEIVLDDLRDYRFYTDDMCHPSAQAVEYIWEKFQKSVIDDSCKPIINQIDSIAAACAHRPFNANTAEHKAFQQKIIGKIEQLQTQYPFMNFTNELTVLQ